MPILLDLFLTFFLIGLFTFGGGYSAIPLIKEQVINHSWLTENQLLTFIGIGEATPGPFAINIATLVGSSQAGILGSLCATLGFVLPSFIIILLIAIIFTKVIQNKFVRNALDYVKPVMVALIFVSASFLLLNAINYQNILTGEGNIDFKVLGIVGTLIILKIATKVAIHKKLNSILIILISAILGIIIYSI